MTTPSEMARKAEERRKRFERLRSSVSPQQAQNISGLARQNPSLTPGVLFGAGMAGVKPGTPAAQKISEEDFKEKKGNWLSRAAGGVYRAGKAVGSALLPDEVGEAADAVAPAIKGVTRGATIGLSSIGQASQGIGRAAFRDGFQLSDLEEGAKQTDLYQASREVQESGGFRGLFTGDTDVDYGSGFFAGGDVVKRRRAAELKAAGGARIGGKTYTAGRFLANSIGLEPGAKAYNIVSGLADAVVALGTDPTSYTPAGVTKPLQARKLLSGDASKGFDAEGVAAQIDEGMLQARKDRGFITEPAEGVADEDVVATIGGLRGIRNTVNSDRVLEFLTADKRGQQLVKYISTETDFGKLYDATKGKLPPQLLLKLAEREMTGDEVIEILGPELGRTARTAEKFGLDIEAKATVASGPSKLGTVATAEFVKRKRNVRAFGTLGGERNLPTDDLPETLRRADLFMKNALIDDDIEVVTEGGRVINRSEVLRGFAAADGNEGVLSVAMDMMKLGSEKAMRDFGIDRDRADTLFRIFADTHSDNRRYWVERVVADGEAMYADRAFNFTSVAEDGVKETRGVPHLASQFFHGNIPLPDPREIRREMSKFKGVLSLPGVQPSLTALNLVQEQVFKPLVLLRPAYILRNQIDEQFRPAGVGMNSLFSHPIQYLHWTLSDQRGVGKLLAQVGFESRGQTFSPDGQYFDVLTEGVNKARGALQDAKRANAPQAEQDALRQALKDARKARVTSQTPVTDAMSEFTRMQTGGLGNWRNRSFAQINGDSLYNIEDRDYARAMGELLHRIHTDPVARRIAAGEDIEQIKADWWRGPLQGFRVKLAKEGERMGYLSDEVGAAQYIDDTVRFVDDQLAQSPELRAAAASGRLNGKALTDGDTPEISKAFIDEMNTLKQIQGFQGPRKVLGSRLIQGAGEDGNAWTRTTDRLFYRIAEQPTQQLTKSPAFRQRYYTRGTQLIGFMSDEAADTFIASAMKANLSGKEIKAMRAARRPGGTMTFDEADLVAKGDSVEYVRDLFYSLHERSQFFDITRLLFPFGEAFFDSAKKYTQLTANNPVLPYRLLQGIGGARDLDVDGDGKGFFYTDDQTGEEMFAMPLVGALVSAADKVLPESAERAIGMDFDSAGIGQWRGPVKNLNILGTSVIPGFGPSLQIGAAYMLPKTADFDGMRELISPYGDRTLAGGALESFLPAWAKKAITGFNIEGLSSPEQQAAFVQGKKDWMAYLASTGDYNLSDPLDQQRLTDDAAVKTRSTFLIRALAQAFAPSPPSPEFVALDKDGKLMTQFKLAEEYYKILEDQEKQGTPENANAIFIQTFGEGAVLATIPNTQAGEGRSPLPENEKARKFYTENRRAAGRFPSVFGLFAPDEESADFDFQTYRGNLQRGDRVAITPEEAISRANQRVARMIYTQAQGMVTQGEDGKPKPNKQEKAALKQLKDRLAEDFPGYSRSFSADTDGLVEDLKRAAADPTLGKTEAGQALNVWLQARDIAEQTSQERYGVSWKTAKDSEPIRVQMRALGARLLEDFPEFKNVYERVLEREMGDD